ncbi:MAG TPA: LLM class flavin-dependent oxidoreductase [Dehalococcoidia bacterium]|nr:LLM class flavin-dependent oxidoreductase [Dehalococcoidia bacterium]
MNIGVGLDFTLGLSYEDQVALGREAAEQGYDEIWTPEGSGPDSFQLCQMRWQASKDVLPEGLRTGISVSPVAYRTPMGFAMSAGTLGAQTNGRFVLGIGSGQVYRAAFRKAMGIRSGSTLAIMRDYLTTVRGLLAGEMMNYEGPALTVQGQKLGIDPPPQTPVYLGALGPKMLALGGEAADGICLNWCTPDQIALARETVDAGAKIAGREAGSVPLHEYIRICVDDDVDVARAGLARATIGYAMGPAGVGRDARFGYRPHFDRMGFADELAELDKMRDGGATQEELNAAASDDLLLSVGYYGTPDGAYDHFRKLAEGLDVAVVRVVAAKPGLDAVRAVMQACAPAAQS